MSLCALHSVSSLSFEIETCEACLTYLLSDALQQRSGPWDESRWRQIVEMRAPEVRKIPLTKERKADYYNALPGITSHRRFKVFRKL